MPDASILRRVSAATANFGMLAVTGTDVAHEALASFVSCALTADLNLRQASPGEHLEMKAQHTREH